MKAINAAYYQLSERRTIEILDKKRISLILCELSNNIDQNIDKPNSLQQIRISANNVSSMMIEAKAKYKCRRADKTKRKGNREPNLDNYLIKTSPKMLVFFVVFVVVSKKFK